jgi:multidrug efflux pump
VFGLGFATVLTLVVTPAALMAMANFAAWRVRLRERWVARRGARRAPEATPEPEPDYGPEPLAEAAE